MYTTSKCRLSCIATLLLCKLLPLHIHLLPEDLPHLLKWHWSLPQRLHGLILTLASLRPLRLLAQTRSLESVVTLVH